MHSIGKAKVGVGVVLVAAAAGVLASAGSPATAGQVASNHGDVAKIKMVQKGRDLTFTGPKKVEKGRKLRIVNDTNPKKVGPHTFTLITSKNMPTSKKKQKKCEEPQGCLRRHRGCPQVRPEDEQGQQAERGRRQKGVGQALRYEGRLLVHREEGHDRRQEGDRQARHGAALLLRGSPVHAGQDQGGEVAGPAGRLHQSEEARAEAIASASALLIPSGTSSSIGSRSSEGSNPANASIVARTQNGMWSTL